MPKLVLTLVEVVNRDPASGFSQQEQRYTQSYEAFLQASWRI